MFYFLIITFAAAAAAILSFLGGMVYSSRKERAKIMEVQQELVENADFVFQALDRYFRKEKPYLNPNLDVNETARYVLTNRTYLAKAIKQNGMVNFNYYVNTFRINEAIMILKSERYVRIGEVALRCGFNSTSAFTMAFKASVGITPKEWRERYFQALEEREREQQKAQPRLSLRRILHRK